MFVCALDSKLIRNRICDNRFSPQHVTWEAECRRFHLCLYTVRNTSLATNSLGPQPWQEALSPPFTEEDSGASF